jgi:hypothetical protein
VICHDALRQNPAGLPAAPQEARSATHGRDELYRAQKKGAFIKMN